MKKALLIWFLLSCSLLAEKAAAPIKWQQWDGAFASAQTENKLVLLDLEAVWCHWCHVMDQTTYRDPEVVRLLNSAYIPVKVDQDSRPDLSSRYQDYGWPATIILDQNGRELACLSGYVKPQRMRTILKSLSENPQPMDSVEPPPAASGPGSLDSSLLARLERRHADLYDPELGGWGQVHKFVNPEVVEYCLRRGLEGETEQAAMARKTLDANLALIDPVWGGVYQYSDSGVWDSPHFEKIMSTQAGNLKVYSLAYAQFGDERYLQAADSVANYLLTFLRSPEGAFYVSQDADLKPGQKATDYFSLDDPRRRAQGVPRIDTHLYSRENGLAIEALALYSAVASRPEALEAARRAARWVLAHRQGSGGLLRHGEQDQTVWFLGDTLQMGRACLMLYRVTGEPDWLLKAEGLADAIESAFTREQSDGYFTSSALQTRDRKENSALARFADLLYAHLGEARHRDMATRALAYFAIEGVTDYFNPGGILLAVREHQQTPTHITIVGPAEAEPTQALTKAAAASPTTFLRLDRWTPGTPLPPHSEVEYPDVGYPAAYLCTGNRCSRPLKTAEALRATWSQP